MVGFSPRLIHDDIFSWEGWGGTLRLASGKCRLRIFDLQKGDTKGLSHLKPIIVVVSDVSDSRMSIKSCAGHLATKVSESFHIDPARMLYIEHYPAVTYGKGKQKTIPERYEAVELTWIETKAIQPKWRMLKSPMLGIVENLLRSGSITPSRS